MGKKKNKIFLGLFWSFGERITAQLVTTIVTIILARLLTPNDYGIISIVTVLINLLNIFVTTGFVSALVQKKNATEEDYNTAFLLSLAIAIVLYLLLFMFSPLIASFYGKPVLTCVFRVMGLRLVLASINSIQQAYIRREMKFKRFFIATLLGTAISGVVGVGLAYAGFGVWALVAQYLTNTTIDTIVLFCIGGWKPKLQFSSEKATAIWSFGWKVLLTQLICGIEDNVRSLIVGKVFGTSDLAFYDQGNKYPNILVSNINSAVEKVMLPAYSKQQDNIDALRGMLRRTINVGIFILAPILIGFGVVAEQFVTIVLTDKWLPAVPFIQIFCLSYLTRPLEVACRQALLAIGKSKEVLICIISIDGTGLIFVFFSVFVLKSVIAIAMFSLITTLISIMVFLRFTNRLLNYQVKDQLQDFIPSLILAFCMGISVYIVGLIKINSILQLLLQIFLGVFMYLLGAEIFKIEPFLYLKKQLLRRLVVNR